MSRVTDPAAPHPPGPHIPQPSGRPSSGPWAAPAAPPFGAPGAPAGARPPQIASGYALPAGYAAPGFSGPVAPTGRARRALGIAAMYIALIATAGAAVVAAVAGFNIALGAAGQLALGAMDAPFDWRVLTPVRGWVLLGEIAFWLGTGLGVWALVQGVIAIVKDRGRGAGVAAVVIAALGPVVFLLALQLFLSAGWAAAAAL
jgi:hypothetical protein